MIELLVVIAVISMLMALLLPALENSKRAAQTLRCLNDQKTVSTAMQYYSQDYDDYIVPFYAPDFYPVGQVLTHWTGWWFYYLLDGSVSAYGITVNGGDYIKKETAEKIMLDVPPAKDRKFPDYCVTGYGYFKQSYTAPRKMFKVAKPSRSMWLGDSATTTDYTYYNVWQRSAYIESWKAVHYRHPGMTAIASFPDGHGTGINPDAQFTADYWSLWTDMQ